MSLSIRTNVSSLDAQRNLSATTSQLDSTLSKLSSGYRITKASDDAAGLGVSVSLEAQISSFNQASRNANDGVSLVQTAEGSMNAVTNILTRMRELAMESSSDGVGNSQRAYINTEQTQLANELDRMQQTAKYNGSQLFGASGSSSVLNFQVGIDGTSNDRISVDTSKMSIDSTSLAVNSSSVDLSTATGAQAALAKIDAAIQTISSNRSALGAIANRFQSVISNIQSTVENFSAANSRIKDVDVAEESAKMSRLNILSQAGVSVLAQANQSPQLALKLLG
ncbi:flagellin N-terminal helical domain-containing protein [Anaeromyxobacter paludicola]|uniref:Flagellin n=1 Tax=Anaeromyxobacter paludicola TaxID=2918171 RepID=A0ABM7X849_9BACT|nr:flagellin [Anaeromyxobacter paludicola]BDG08015.1 flagellin [Anaeromyxobacter paludicola]